MLQPICLNRRSAGAGGRAALTLFWQATRKETATVELARRLGQYLYRAQHRPDMRFEAGE